MYYMLTRDSSIEVRNNNAKIQVKQNRVNDKCFVVEITDDPRISQTHIFFYYELKSIRCNYFRSLSCTKYHETNKPTKLLCPTTNSNCITIIPIY